MVVVGRNVVVGLGAAVVVVGINVVVGLGASVFPPVVVGEGAAIVRAPEVVGAVVLCGASVLAGSTTCAAAVVVVCGASVLAGTVTGAVVDVVGRAVAGAKAVIVDTGGGIGGNGIELR